MLIVSFELILKVYHESKDKAKDYRDHHCINNGAKAPEPWQVPKAQKGNANTDTKEHKECEDND